MKRDSNSEKTSELETAIAEWKDALKRFDSAERDEIRFVALEIEAAKRRYMFLLNKQR